MTEVGKKLFVLDPPSLQPGPSPVPTNDHPLVFLHIPKAAGTTVEAIINCVADLYGLEHGRIAGPLFHAPFGPGKTPVLHQLENMPRGTLRSLSFVSGHLPFGIDDELERPGVYFTFLREPFARTVSHYKMGVRRDIWPEGTPIGDLIASGQIPDNAMVRQLSGSRDPGAPCNEDMFERALNNLRRFPIVGISERFIESLQALQRFFRWPGIIYENYQLAPSSQEGPPDPPAIIERANLFDARLYDAYAGRESLVQNDAIGDALRPRLAGNPSAQSINGYVISAPSIVKGGADCGVVNEEEWDHLARILATQNITIERHGPGSTADFS